MRTSVLFYLAFVTLAFVSCSKTNGDETVATMAPQFANYSFQNASQIESLFAIRDNYVSVTMSPEEALRKGISMQIYSKLLSMVDSLNEKSDSLMNQRWSRPGTAVLLEMNILVYSWEAGGQPVFCNAVSLPSGSPCNPSVAVVQCSFSQLSGGNSGSHLVGIYSENNVNPSAGIEAYGDVTASVLCESVAWPIRLGYTYLSYYDNPGICLWQVYGWIDPPLNQGYNEMAIE